MGPTAVEPGQHPERLAARGLSGVRPLVVAIVATLALGAMKLAAGLVSGSQAVVASAVDSLADAVVSGVNLLLMRQATKPADAGHPWGHGKAEALASLAQAMVLAGVVGFIVFRAVSSLRVAARAPPDAEIAFVVMMGSMAGALAISMYLARAATATGSLILRTDAVHYRMDLFSGAAVVLGLVVGRISGWVSADPIASLVVSALMVKDVFDIGKEAIDELMDRPLPDHETARLVAVLAGFDRRICSWHALRTRRAGPVRFAQVHVVLPPTLTFAEAHSVSSEVEIALRAALPNLDVIVHADVEAERA